MVVEKEVTGVLVEETVVVVVVVVDMDVVVEVEIERYVIPPQ